MALSINPSTGKLDKIGLESTTEGTYLVSFDANGNYTFVPAQGADKVGQIVMFAGEILPVNFLPCFGQEELIASYPLLYANIGNTYENGVPAATGYFRMPDFRDRFPVGANGNLGVSSGSDTLDATQLPQHNHSLNVVVETSNDFSPDSNFIATGELNSENISLYRDSGTIATLASQSIGNAGNGEPHKHPQLAVTFGICYESLGIANGFNWGNIGGTITDQTDLTDYIKQINSELTEQIYTSGGSFLINENTDIVYIDPIATVSNLTLLLPNAPINGKEIKISFGGNIQLGTVVESLSINGVQTVLNGGAIFAAKAGDGYILKYQSFSPTTGTWRIFGNTNNENLVTIAGNYTCFEFVDIIEVNSTSAAVQVTLPSTLKKGKIVRITWIAGTNPVTIVSDSGFKLVDIDGSLQDTITITALQETYHYYRGSLRYQAL